MKAFDLQAQLDSLEAKIAYQLERLVRESKKASNYVGHSTQVDLRQMRVDYEELIYVNGKVQLIDSNGLHYDLCTLDLQEQIYIIKMCECS